MGPNMPKCAQHVLNGSKQVKAGANRCKPAQHGWTFSKMVFNCEIWLKSCLKWSKMVKVSLKCHKMIQNGPKCSNMVKYDLILCNMLQMLSLRSSKLVQHNQVSWSSLLDIWRRKKVADLVFIRQNFLPHFLIQLKSLLFNRKCRGFDFWSW